MEKQVVLGIKTSFVGFHRWVNAPEAQAFLRNMHRHVFNVTVEFELRSIANLDRPIEYFAAREDIDFILGEWADREFDDSCEVVAYSILGHLDNMYMDLCKSISVTVQEDSENYARVTGYAN